VVSFSLVMHRWARAVGLAGRSAGRACLLYGTTHRVAGPSGGLMPPDVRYCRRKFLRFINVFCPLDGGSGQHFCRTRFDK